MHTLDRINAIFNHGFGIQQWIGTYKKGPLKLDESLKACAASCATILKIIELETNTPIER